MTEKIGFSDFRRTGITIEYTHIDLTKKQVTSTISYEGKLMLKVIVDLQSDVVHTDGSIDEVLHLTPGRDEYSYIQEIKDWSKIFIENNINNPKEYFNQFRL